MSINRAEERKNKIRVAFINAAVGLILEQGYDAVTVADIARVADYGRSTFYLYFDDKEDLVWKILLHYMQVMDEQILDSVAHLETPLREWRAWYMIFASVDAQRAFFMQMDGELSRRLRQLQKDHLIATYERQLREGVYSIRQDVPPEIGARYVVGAILEILEYWLDYPELGTAEQMCDTMFRLVFRQEPPRNAR